MSVDLPKIREFVEILKNTETKETIAIKLEKAQNLPLTTSKVGGLPFLAQDAEIPTNSEGQQLTLLAQINCEELPENDFYPKKGILQFWILCDDVYGLDFDNQISNENKRIIYISDLKNGLSEEEIAEKYQPFVEDNDYCYSPFYKKDAEFSLNFEKKMKGISTSDFQFDQIFTNKWNEFFPENIIEDIYDLDDEIMEEIWDTLTDDANHQIGGYPYFTQQDPRESEKYQKYTEMLLQIDSEFSDKEKKWDIIWGDCGVANFFISKENLEKLDFSEVLYNWDCS